MTIERFSVSYFKAHCTELLRRVEREGRVFEVTNHGRVIATVAPPASADGMDPTKWLGSLRDTVIRQAEPEAPVSSGAWEITFD